MFTSPLQSTLLYGNSVTSGGCLTSSFLSMDAIGTILNAYMYWKNNVLITRNWTGILTATQSQLQIEQSEKPARSWTQCNVRNWQACVTIVHTKGPVSAILLFPVDSHTHEIFCRLQSNVLNATSLFKTNHVVVLWKTTTWRHFACVALWLFRFTWCSFTTFTFKRKAYRGFCLP